MKNIEVFKQFSRNMALALGAFAVMWGAAMLSEHFLGNSLYLILAMFIVLFVALTWMMSASQVESKDRDQQRQQAERERKTQRRMLTE